MISKDTFLLAEDLFARAWAQTNKITDANQLAQAAIEAAVAFDATLARTQKAGKEAKAEPKQLRR